MKKLSIRSLIPNLFTFFSLTLGLTAVKFAFESKWQISVSLVIFASWKPERALLGAILFAGLDAYQVRAQQLAGAFIPYQFFLMLPFLLSIVAMIIAAKKTRYPKSLLIPFRRGERH